MVIRLGVLGPKAFLRNCEPHLGHQKHRFASRSGAKDASLWFDVWGGEMGPAMALALKIIGWWVLLSCTLGPCLTWLFFYGERESRQAKDRLPVPHRGNGLPILN